MPKFLVYILLILLIAMLIPPAIIASARTTVKKKPRVHLVQDMDNQHRFEMQHVNKLFNDGRAMRPAVPGTVGRGQLDDDAHFIKGLNGDAWATGFPSQIEVNETLVLRGQDRFNIYCTPCHGGAGYGDGMVHQRAMQLLTAGKNGTTWVAPKSLHEAAIRAQPIGQIFNTITNGVRTMPAYGDQIPVADRWAIVAYIKALQRSQHATAADLPSGTNIDQLDIEKLSPEEIKAAEEANAVAGGATTTDSGAEQP